MFLNLFACIRPTFLYILFSNIASKQWGVGVGGGVGDGGMAWTPIGRRPGT